MSQLQIDVRGTDSVLELAQVEGEADGLMRLKSTIMLLKIMFLILKNQLSSTHQSA